MNEQGSRELTGPRREVLEALPGLRRFALSLTGNAADADNLLEITVASVLESGLPDEAELAPWCIRVCRHLWMDEIRARQRRQTVGSDCAPDGERSQRGDSASAAVQRALAELSDEQRAVFELVAVEGLSYRRTGAILDMPIGRVMSRLARARGALIARWPSERSTSPERKAANGD